MPGRPRRGGSFRSWACWRGEVGALRELEVSLGVAVCHRAAGLSGGVAGNYAGGHGRFFCKRICRETASGAASQDLLLLSPVLIYSGGLGHWHGFISNWSGGFTRGLDSYGSGHAGGGAGQTQWLCRPLSGRMRGGGDHMFEEQWVIYATVPHTLRPSGVYWKRLGVEDAELLIEFLCYLTGELDQVAAV